MLAFVEGDLFASPAQTLVNAVNTAGVMGKGIAAEFRRRYPAMFAEYRRACEDGTLAIGTLHLWRGSERWILNFPTKQHWRSASRIEWIAAGLREFADTYESLGITSIAFPRLGCGLGGLDWAIVEPLMVRALEPLPIEVAIHSM